MQTYRPKPPSTPKTPAQVLKRALFAVVSFAFGPSAGSAQAGPPEAACHNDIEKYCVGSERGTALKACLLQHEKLVSLTCQQTMTATYRNNQKAEELKPQE